MTLFVWLWSWPAIAVFEIIYWIAGKSVRS
jgi:hypothetical protein